MIEMFICTCGHGPLPWAAWTPDPESGYLRCPRCRGSPELDTLTSDLAPIFAPEHGGEA